MFSDLEIGCRDLIWQRLRESSEQQPTPTLGISPGPDPFYPKPVPGRDVNYNELFLVQQLKQPIQSRSARRFQAFEKPKNKKVSGTCVAEVVLEVDSSKNPISPYTKLIIL